MPKSDSERFWSKVSKENHPGGCWLWTRYRNKFGYGQFKIGGVVIPAHRVAATLSGVEIPDGMFVLHRCDNPSCVNPDHLWIGTHKENMRDMSSKGRAFASRRPESLQRGDDHWTHRMPGMVKRGSENPAAKLKESDVVCVSGMLAVGRSLEEIAKLFRVTPSCIRRIRDGLSWRSVTSAG